MSADTTTVEPAASTVIRRSNRNPASPDPSNTNIPDSSSTEPDLASAMKMMKAALAAEQSTKPEVLDVFNKFMESVVSTLTSMNTFFCIWNKCFGVF